MDESREAVWHRQGRLFLIAAAAMLPLAAWRFIVAFDTRQSLCGDQDREHMGALISQGVAALAIAGILFMLRPSVVQGDEQYRVGAVALLVAAILVFVGVFTKNDLMAFSSAC